MLRLNVERTYPANVNVEYIDDQGKRQAGKFRATYRVMTQEQLAELREELPSAGSAIKPILDRVVVSIDELELFDKEGAAITGPLLLEAAKNDITLSVAMAETFWETVGKKSRNKT